MDVLCGYEECLKQFRRRLGPGRPQTYCQPSCRRQAQRLRDKHALLDARRDGPSWDSITRAMRVSLDAARRRWREATVPGASSPSAPGGDDAVAEPPGASGAQEDVAPLRSSRQQLGAAVSYVLHASGRTVGAVADQAGVPATTFARLLSGERLPEWPAVFTLVTVLGGQPEDFRTLWVWAKGRTPSTSRDGATALARFHAALRGLHLSAGRPPLTGLGRPWPDDAPLDVPHDIRLGTPLVTPLDARKARRLETVLSGGSMTDWDDTALLVRLLGGRPEQFRPLWDDVQHNLLAQYSVLALSVKSEPDKRDSEGRD
ncbi:helix-turn-helix domain-containing protein [Streptomyces sp. NPDC058195]|uniref:helix-turn-helix domain-containing protein n=1 Tax=Streptomyces sp. NPDC058195 TaxID=3346375 RepID=UPI0036EC61B3